MISKKYRTEVWERNKPYLDNPETVEDLGPCCELCKRAGEGKTEDGWCKFKDTCPVFQLWLSNEYQEWENDYRSLH